MAKGTCSVEGCERPDRTMGMCGAHYVRFRRHGDVRADIPLKKMPTGSTKAEIRGALIDRNGPLIEGRPELGPCHLWMGGLNGSGYGAHRRIWVDANGPVPKGFDLDHLCRVRRCVNLDHLEVVTHSVNMRRSPTVGRNRSTHCIHGHERTPENTYVSPKGHRVCRLCIQTIYPSTKRKAS